MTAIQKIFEEQPDDDLFTAKDAKAYVHSVFTVGRERMEQLEKIEPFHNDGSWYVPNTWTGYESDFDSQANNQYFTDTYKWLEKGSRVSLDPDRVGDEYGNDFERFLGLIPTSEWEQFIEDVKSATNGAVDDQLEQEYTQRKETRFVEEDLLPDLKRELRIRPDFEDSFLQYTIEDLTAKDLWDFMHDLSVYPEREGRGGVWLDAEHLAEDITPEMVLATYPDGVEAIKEAWLEEKRRAWDTDHRKWFVEALHAYESDPDVARALARMDDEELFEVLVEAVPDANFADAQLPHWQKIKTEMAVPPMVRWVVLVQMDTTQTGYANWKHWAVDALKLAAEKAIPLLLRWSRKPIEHPEFKFEARRVVAALLDEADDPKKEAMRLATPKGWHCPGCGRTFARKGMPHRCTSGFTKNWRGGKWTPVFEAKRSKRLPDEENIDYAKYVKQGGYDSGTEVYADDDVRILVPATGATWQKYMGTPPYSNVHYTFMVIPVKAPSKAWAFRVGGSGLESVDTTGRATGDPFADVLASSPFGDKVRQVMVPYFKKKLRDDFDEYIQPVVQLGGLDAVRGYLKRIQPGTNPALDHAAGLEAAQRGNFKAASKFLQHPEKLMDKDGPWIIFKDWTDTVDLFSSSRNHDYKSAAETLFGGDAYSWFDWLWQYPPKVNEVTPHLLPEHWDMVRKILVGRKAFIDDDWLRFDSKVLKDFSNSDLESLIDDADEHGADIEEIAKAIQHAGVRALESLHEDAYFKGYTEAVTEVLGSNAQWIKHEGKDYLGFHIPWKSVHERFKEYREENGDEYDGSLFDLVVEHSEKAEPSEEYYASFSDDKDGYAKKALSYELSELEPKSEPKDPNQPELFEQ
jgi:hypothetical protein